MSRRFPCKPHPHAAVSFRVVVVLGSLVGLGALTGPTDSFAQAFTVGVRLDLPITTGVRAVNLTDLDGDGSLDLITANGSAHSASVYLGDGFGGFGPKTDYASLGDPIEVGIGDFNGDGKLDLVIVPNGANFVAVRLGNGLGGFGPQQLFSTEFGAESVAVGDVNGDNRLDLVVPCYTIDVVSVLLGDGAGRFAPFVNYPVGDFPNSVAIGDLNADGRADLAVANSAANSVSILLGTGGGAFGPPTNIPAPGSTVVALADLNNDGKLDLGVGGGGPSPTISIALGNGSGGFGARTDIGGTLAGVQSVTMTDVNSDGLCDFVAGGSGLHVLLGDGAGGLGTPNTISIAGGATASAVGDVNGDGKADIVAGGFASTTIAMLLGSVGGMYGARTSFATGSNPMSVAIADLNQDSKADVAVANYYGNTVSVFPGNGQGGFGPRTNHGADVGPATIVATDMTIDGKPDLILANQGSNTFSLLVAAGAGAFNPGVSVAAGAGAFGLAVGDFNADGKRDLATANYFANNLAVFFGSGNTTFPPPNLLLTGANPTCVALPDLNADGRLDVVSANYGANTVSVFLGNGSGSFTAKTDFATGTNPRWVAAGDMTGDGKVDLVTTNLGAGTISVLPGNGLGGFGAKTDFGVGTSPHWVSIADANLDGRLDVTVANYGSNTVSVLLGNGAGGFGARTDLPVGAAPQSSVFGDLNGDGAVDLVTADGNSDAISVFLALQRTRATLSVPAGPVVLGQPLTLTATVSAVAPVSLMPTGTVSFYDGTTLLGTAPVVGGVAALAVFAPYLGSRSLSAVYSGDGRMLRSFSATKPLRVVSTARPSIASVVDVPADQGRQIRLRFRASPFDYTGSGTPITQYEVYRRIAASSATSVVGDLAEAKVVATTGRGVAGRPASILVDGWDFVGALTAHGDSAYVIVVPTISDSNASGLHRAVLFVRAATATPTLYYDSDADSGYSVDNLPPVPPAPFTAMYTAGVTHLHWGPNPESDFWYYRLYRGSSSTFVPGSANLIAATTDTGRVDPGAAGSYYKLSAVDVNGNESGYATLGPSTIVGVTDGPALAFALERIRPNPVAAARLALDFVLRDAAPARLELIDVTGRRVVDRAVGELGPGPHRVVLSETRGIAPGVYMVRLTQGANTRTQRVVIMQ